MFYILLSTVATVLGILYWHFSFKRKFSSLNKIPGPTPLPIIGNALDFGLTPVDFLKNMVRLNSIFGHHAKGWMGPTSMYLFSSDPEFIEHILSSPKYICKGSDYKLFRPWLGNGLIISTGDYWQKRRKIINSAFHFKILDDFISAFNNETNKLIKRLVDNVGKIKCDIQPYITACALDIICETTMGTSVRAQDNFNNEYVNAVKTMTNIIIERLFSSWKRFDLLFQFSSSYKEQNKALNIINGFTQTVIKQRRQKLLNMNSTSVNEKDDDTGIKKKSVFLDVLFQASIDGKALSDEDIREEVNTFMVAGHDTTASLIGFAIHELARNPKVQNKMLTELRGIFGNDKSYEPTMQDLHEMKYTELVLKETLRLYPTIPYIGRFLEEDLHYKGTTYPKGLEIGLFIYAMHRRPDLFPEADKFKPERFLDKNIVNNPFAYVPFSAGPRNCIGQKFAMYEIKCIISKIIMNFEFLHSDEVVLSAAMVLKSANGINVQFKNRQF